MAIRTAIVLAAGGGRKFWPYATVRNKCAFPIGNVPLVRRLVEQLQEVGCRRIIVVEGERSGSVRAALAGVEGIEYVRQTASEGTAAAASLAAQQIPDEPFLLAYGDTILDPANLRALMDAFAEDGVEAAALVTPLGRERPGDWITCRVRDGAAVEFQGHGRGGSYRLGGIFAFTPRAAAALAATPDVMTHVPVGGMPAPEREVGETLARLSDAGTPVRAVESTGFLVDIDKPWHVLEAADALLRWQFAQVAENRIAEGCRIAESAEIRGRVVLEPGAEIGERVVIQGDAWLEAGARVTNGAILGGGCRIGARARVRDYALVGGHSVVGPDTITGHGAEFDGVLLEGAYLYHYCEISGVCGARVDIGAATVCGTLRFDDGLATPRIAGRPEQPLTGANSTYLGDYSRTGVNAVLMPGVRTGAYSCVGPGVVLYEDLPERKMVLVRQEREYKDWGPERYGW